MPKPRHALCDKLSEENRDLRNRLHAVEQPWRERVAALESERDRLLSNFERLKRQNDVTLAALKALMAYMSVTST